MQKHVAKQSKAMFFVNLLVLHMRQLYLINDEKATWGVYFANLS